MKHSFSIDFYITYARSVASVMSNSFVTLWTSLPGSSVHEDSPGKNTEVSCYALFQGILLTQGSNPHLLCLLY